MAIRNDLIDEALDLFRPNCFSKTFEIRGPSDRTLVYLLLYIGDCLARLRLDMSLSDAQRTLLPSQFALPGEAGFPLNGMFPAAGRESEQLKAYLTSLRNETVNRLLARVYAQDAKVPSRWWMAFSKRKFMNKSLS
ncbi:Actin-related protein 2/3 complex subunit 3 [Paramicrosporidium saccamoebae]|uniref:Actin-related protein 2/3 complex subunit 3 n=1 Tax=Paramicrosporidium saccamoebae TaxID=1246581 RepID=A0A2H9TKF9_9FUNG|nr:Actin-related protein 2/3 complex subunit 3 [Paramicrosporidium saccamoebae]